MSDRDQKVGRDTPVENHCVGEFPSKVFFWHGQTPSLFSYRVDQGFGQA